MVLRCTNYLYITINPCEAVYQTRQSTPPSVRLLSLYTLALTDHSSQVISLTHQISTLIRAKGDAGLPGAVGTTMTASVVEDVGDELAEVARPSE